VALDERSITTLLHSWRAGDAKARDEILERLYPELRRLAAHYMKSERAGHTLQPTALVHELYLRFLSADEVQWQDRVHFFAFAARKLRHILVDHARRAKLKDQLPLLLPPSRAVPAGIDVLALDQALEQLETVNSRAAHLLELRFFAGLTDQESAEVLHVSIPTVHRDWRFARAWLAAHILQR